MYTQFWSSLGYHGTTLSILNSITIYIIWATIISVLICVIGCIAFWKMFQKAGEKGWKAIIPFYNVYTLCKLTWKTDFFWIQFLVVACAIFCSTLQTLPQPWKSIFGITSLIMVFVAIFFCFVGNYRIARSYGHSTGYMLGLVFLPFIFTLILGFGSSEYKGNVYMKELKKK